MKQIWIGGRLANTPELKTISRDNKELKLVNFSIASNDRSKKGTTSFFNCVAFGKTAEFIAKLGKKGVEAFVLGEPRNSVNKKDGKSYPNFEVIVDQFHFSNLSITNDKTTPISAADFSDADYY